MSAVIIRYRPRMARPKCASCGIPLHEHEIETRIDGQARESDEQASCWQCEWFEDEARRVDRARIALDAFTAPEGGS
jgi:hypothetical protein